MKAELPKKKKKNHCTQAILDTRLFDAESCPLLEF